MTGFYTKHNTELKWFKHSKFDSWKIDILPAAQDLHKKSPFNEILKRSDMVSQSFNCISCKEAL